MPVKKSAFKRLRQAKVRQARSAKWRSDVEALVRKVRKAVVANDAAKAKDWLTKSIRVIDRAGRRGAVKKNAVNRLKSRLTRADNKLSRR